MTPYQKIEELQKDAKLKIAQAESDKIKVYVGSATCELAAGSNDVKEKFIQLLSEKGLSENILIKQTGCTGFCADEPIVQIVKDGKKTTYKSVTADKVNDLIEKHIEKGEVIKAWTL
ncbi:MAG: (2Fe-2S) ferredoxin domain-containing protein [Candidatus Margulisiibacteriota bacterium]|jgi:NADP-reducing hydrogenase subunit HndB